jgi:hypothetical protein
MGALTDSIVDDHQEMYEYAEASLKEGKLGK